MISELKIEVIGRVQGIGFRAMIKSYADKNGLKGYVANLDNGNVKIDIQGEKNKLDDFIEWIKTNPGMSKVIEMKIDIKKIKNKYDKFEIKKEYGYIEDKSRSFINLGKSIF